LVSHGVGTQGYVCLPSGTGASWTVNNARPEATLFVNLFGGALQIITHFLSPVENPNDVGPQPPRFGDSIAAGCGHKKHVLFPLHPTRVARTLERSTASCCRQSGRNRGQLAAPH
jgi:hypothetical protein